MAARRYIVGLDLDVAKKELAASIGITPWKLLAGPATFSDSLEGFQALIAWLQAYHCSPDETVLCMEATGYAADPLAYFLAAQGYALAVEPPVKVRRMFPLHDGKPEERNSQHVARYAFRSLGDLRMWQPSTELLDRVRLLLDDCEGAGQDRQGELKPASAHTARRPLRSRLQAIDDKMRDLLQPQATITQDWPCF